MLGRMFSGSSCENQRQNALTVHEEWPRTLDSEGKERNNRFVSLAEPINGNLLEQRSKARETLSMSTMIGDLLILFIPTLFKKGREMI